MLNRGNGAEPESLDGITNRKLHRFHAGAGFLRGFQHVAADLLAVPDIFIDRKHRE